MDATINRDGPPTFDQVMTDTHTEYEQVQKEIKEIGLLIRQTTSEVEKLAQKNHTINRKIQGVEANLDSYPRQDIKEIYKTAQDAHSRLFMMRGQVEQLQGKQQYLERYAKRLKQVVDAYQRDGPTPEPAVSSSSSESVDTDDSDESSIINIINAQESERLHLSKQLHDGPAQSLTNLILQAEICERLFDKDPMRARTELGNLKEGVNTTFQKIREYIFELRPMMLDDLGLIPTLRQYIQEYENKHGVNCNLNITGPEQRFAPHTEVTFFRVTQALLTNVATHANATRVQVAVDIQSSRIVGRVEDDGSGFDVAEVKAMGKKRKQMGIISMQEQVTMLRGEINFDSNIGQGTVVNLWLPRE